MPRRKRKTDRSTEALDASRVLWRALGGVEREVHRPGVRYWYDNLTRPGLPAWVIQMSLEGNITIEFEGKEYAVGIGDVLVFRHGEDSRYGCRDPLAEPYVCAWAIVEGAGLDEHLKALRRRWGPVLAVGGDPTIREALVDVVSALTRRSGQDATGRAAGVARLVHGLFAAAESAASGGLTVAERLADRLAAEPLRPWSLKRLAVEAGVSREHLSRVFVERHGLPPHAFFTRARRARAVWLLRQTDLPLDRVAALSGFERRHTLARQVHTATGMTPSALRAASRVA